MLLRLLPSSPFSCSSSRELLHVEQESHSRGKGNIPLSLPGCCLMESFPLPLPLEQSSGVGPAAISLLGEFLPLPKLRGAVAVSSVAGGGGLEDWMLLKGILVSLSSLGGWELPPFPQPLVWN